MPPTTQPQPPEVEVRRLFATAAFHLKAQRALARVGREADAQAARRAADRATGRAVKIATAAGLVVA